MPLAVWVHAGISTLREMFMNPYIKNLDRIEFLVTLACTGRCRHCSQGEHVNCSESVNGDIAAEIVRKVCSRFRIQSLMTFGGEPLLYPDTVCKIHTAAKEMDIPKRQLITNGYFRKDTHKIQSVAAKLAASGVNDILLSVDAFHQESIPLEMVKTFAKAIKVNGVPLRTHPAWLVSSQSENPYNQKTWEILREFEQMGITSSDGNVIFPSGNALKYLREYFISDQQPDNPYEENPIDVRTINISPNGDTLNDNVYQKDILKIMDDYMPKGT